MKGLIFPLVNLKDINYNVALCSVNNSETTGLSTTGRSFPAKLLCKDRLPAGRGRGTEPSAHPQQVMPGRRKVQAIPPTCDP